MARKKRLSTPAELEVVVVEWEDASGDVREKFTTDLVVNTTVGFLVHEDDKVLVLLTEYTDEDTWLSGYVDFTRIPKPLIIKRETIGKFRTSASTI